MRFGLKLKNFSSFLLLTSNLTSPHVPLTTFSSILRCKISAYKNFSNWTIASAIVETILFVFNFARTLTFDFTTASNFFSVRAWYKQKPAATIQNIINDIKKIFVSHIF